MNKLFLLFTALVSLAANAQPTNTDQPNTVEVECWTQIENQKHAISLRLNSHGKIINWEEDHIAKTNAESILGPLADKIDESGFEYIKSFKAPNGYSIIQAGTTADEFSVGVSKDLTTGFFNYKDMGSGLGNSKYVLSCSKQ